MIDDKHPIIQLIVIVLNPVGNGLVDCCDLVVAPFIRCGCNQRSGNCFEKSPIFTAGRIVLGERGERCSITEKLRV